MIFEEIAPGIVQADFDGAVNVCSTELWKGHNVGGVINCAIELDPIYHPELRYLKLPMLDEMVVPPEWFDQAVLFQKRLSAENKRTVVHCKGGINRSSVVALALMAAWGATVHKAMNRLPRKPWGTPTIASVMAWSETRTV